MADPMIQTIQHKMTLLRQLMAQTQQKVQDVSQQIATLQAERDQAVQVLLRQQGALAGYQELLTTDDTSIISNRTLPLDGTHIADAMPR